MSDKDHNLNRYERNKYDSKAIESIIGLSIATAAVHGAEYLRNSVWAVEPPIILEAVAKARNEQQIVQMGNTAVGGSEEYDEFTPQDIAA